MPTAGEVEGAIAQQHAEDDANDPELEALYSLLDDDSVTTSENADVTISIATEDPAAATCYLCLGGEDEVDDDGQPLSALHRSCACRGTAGYVHLPCAITAGQANAKHWTSCPTCKKRWTASFGISLARARLELSPNLHELDPDKLLAGLEEKAMATLQLSQALIGVWGANATEAQKKESAELEAEAEALVQSMGWADDIASYAANYAALNDSDDSKDAALQIPDTGRMEQEAHKCFEDGDHEKATKLLTEAIDQTRRYYGPESTELYECMGNLSCVYLVAGKFQEALKLAQEALVAQQRILGRAHPSTLMSIAGVGKCLQGIGDHEQAALHLQEAIDGLATVHGAQHPQIASFRHSLTSNNNKVRFGRSGKTPYPVEATAATTNGRYSGQGLDGQPVQVFHYVMKDAVTGCDVRAYACSLWKSSSVKSGGGGGGKKKKKGKKKNKNKGKKDNAERLNLMLEPSEIRLAAGTAVKISGLTGSPELNDRIGTIRGFDETTGRYVVSVKGEKQQRKKALKPGNCYIDNVTCYSEWEASGIGSSTKAAVELDLAAVKA